VISSSNAGSSSKLENCLQEKTPEVEEEVVLEGRRDQKRR
jgi:hypothetical protein